MKITVAIIFYLVFWAGCYACTGSDKKHIAALRTYPEPVRRAVRENPDFAGMVPPDRPVWKTVLGNLTFFAVFFSLLGLVLKTPLGLDNFSSAFLYFLALGEGLGLFDLLIIDLLWWRHTKRIRFSFLPDPEPYQDPKEHIMSFLRGIPMFAAAAVIVALVVSAF